MAKCERVTAVPVPPPVEYKLILNQDEASLLRRLLYSNISCGGAGELMDIGQALADAGVEPAAGKFLRVGTALHPLRYVL